MHFKKWFVYSLLLFMVSYACYAEKVASKTIFHTKLMLDGKQWKLGYSEENEHVQLAEYVTNGENVNNWTQLVTFQKFKYAFPADASPVKFAEKEIAGLKERGYEPIFTTIESGSNEAIIEFRITVTPDQQDEIQRIIKNANSNFIVLHYVIKKSDMGSAARRKWINILKTVNPAKNILAWVHIEGA